MAVGKVDSRRGKVMPSQLRFPVLSRRKHAGCLPHEAMLIGSAPTMVLVGAVCSPYPPCRATTRRAGTHGWFLNVRL